MEPLTYEQKLWKIEQIWECQYCTHTNTFHSHLLLKVRPLLRPDEYGVSVWKEEKSPFLLLFFLLHLSATDDDQGSCE